MVGVGADLLVEAGRRHLVLAGCPAPVRSASTKHALGPASSHQAWALSCPGLCRWEGMHLLPWRITGPLGVKSCGMAMLSRATPAGTGAAVDVAMENHRCKASPTKRRDQRLPLVIRTGFPPAHLARQVRAQVRSPRRKIRPPDANPCHHRSDPARRGRPSLLIPRIA